MTTKTYHDTTDALSYIRFSSAPQADGDSVRRQTGMATNYAEQHGLNLLPTKYLDRAMSGFSGANLRNGALGKLLDIIDPETDTPNPYKIGTWLLTENLDRIGRLPIDEAQDTLRALRKHFRLVSVGDNKIYPCNHNKDYNPNDLESLLVSALVMSRAHEESDRKSKLTRQNWEIKRKKALENNTPMGGRIAPWIKFNTDKKEYELDPKKVKTVKLIFKLYLGGMGTPRIANHLQDNNTLTFSGKKIWHTRAINRILKSPVVVGEYVYLDQETGKEITIPDHYKPIISREDQQKVLELLDIAKEKFKNGNIRHHAKADNNLFRNIVVCSCGSTAYYSSSTSKIGNNNAYYRCKNKHDCPSTNTRADIVNQMVLPWLGGLDWDKIKEGELETENRQRDINIVNQARIDTINERIKDIKEKHPNWIMSDNLTEGINDLEDQQKTLKRAIKPISHLSTISPPTLTNETPTNALDKLFEGIEEDNTARDMADALKTMTSDTKAKLHIVVKDTIKTITINKRTKRKDPVKITITDHHDNTYELDQGDIKPLLARDNRLNPSPHIPKDETKTEKEIREEGEKLGYYKKAIPQT